MRYFRIHDEISAEEGDLYRWDGENLVCKLHDGWSDWADQPAELGSVEGLLTHLAGRQGYWVEVEGE